MRKYNLNIISEEVAPLNKIEKDIVSNASGKALSLEYEQKLGLKVLMFICFVTAIISSIALGDELMEYILFIYISIGLGLFFLFLHKIIPNKYWILNRINQEISIPFVFKNKPRIDHVNIIKSGYYVQTGGKYATVPVVVPVVWHKSKLLFYNVSALTTWKDNEHKGSDTARTWSFYIWYLDKNRPLPPGDVLDPYREEDFQRRKAEGFPPPLFCSCIPTPEATQEQQAEREKYWKDEDYMFRLDRYKKPSLWEAFKPKQTTPLNLEDGAVIISRLQNPDNWEQKPYPEFENFKYLPTAYAMRYEFEDGRIVYSLIDAKTELVCTPHEGEKYKKEIIR